MATPLEIVLEVKEKNTEAIEKVNAQIGETEAVAAKTSAGLIAMGTAVTVAATAVAGLAAAFAKGLSELLDYSEALGKANLSTGLSVEFMQQLVKTGAEVDISFDSMRGAVERMEKALEGNGTALRKFGIQVEDFQGLQPDEAVRKLAVQIMAIEDPMVRAAAAMAATGRSGAEMIPIFAAIVDGSVDAQKVLGTDVVTSLQKTEQALDKAKTAWTTFKQEVIATIAQRLPLEGFLKNAASGIEFLGILAQHSGESMKAMAQAAVMNFPGAIQTILKIADSEARVEVQTNKTSSAVLGMAETHRKLIVALDELVDLWDKEEKANKKAEAQAKKQEAQRVREAKAFERAEEAARKYAMDSERDLLKTWNSIDVAAAAHTRHMEAEEQKQLADDKRKWQAMARAAEQYYRQDTIAAHLNFFKTRSELEETARKAEEAYRQMVAAGVASFDQLRTAHAAWKQAEADLNAKSAVTAIEGFQMVADSASTILRSLFGKSKAAAIAAAIIDTLASIVKTLSAYPWPWSLVPAAAAAAVGYANVDKIRGQEAGFAQGTPGTSFVDFGPGTPTMLHGQEAVVTRSQGDSIASLVEKAIEKAGRRVGQSRTAGSSGEPMHIHLHLDSKQVADVVVRRNRAGLAPMRAV